jgi:hypothetical protein
MILIVILAPMFWLLFAYPQAVAAWCVWFALPVTVRFGLGRAGLRSPARFAWSLLASLAIVALDVVTGGCADCGHHVTIYGRVFDSRTGHPVPDAEVFAAPSYCVDSPDSLSRVREYSRKPDSTSLSGEARLGTTDPEGYFYLQATITWGESTGIITSILKNLNLCDRPPRDSITLLVDATGYKEARQKLSHGRWRNRRVNHTGSSLYEAASIPLAPR